VIFHPFNFIAVADKTSKECQLCSWKTFWGGLKLGHFDLNSGSNLVKVKKALSSKTFLPTVNHLNVCEVSSFS